MSALLANSFSFIRHFSRTKTILRLRFPAVVLANLNHRGENVVPSLLLHQRFVWEHAAVPTDMFHLFCDLALVVAQPVARVAGDVQLALRISSETVAACLFVVT